MAKTGFSRNNRKDDTKKKHSRVMVFCYTYSFVSKHNYKSWQMYVFSEAMFFSIVYKPDIYRAAAFSMRGSILCLAASRVGCIKVFHVESTWICSICMWKAVDYPNNVASTVPKKTSDCYPNYCSSLLDQCNHIATSCTLQPFCGGLFFSLSRLNRWNHRLHH